MILTNIVQRLNTVTENGTIDEYTRTLLCELTAKVIQRLATKHEHIVKKGLLAIEDAAREMEMSVEEFQKKMNT